MKKLFIGCAVILMLIVGLGAYLIHELKPSFVALSDAWSAAIVRLERLDAEHPFQEDSLDAARFARSLELRAQLASYFASIGEDMRALAEEGEAEGGGGFFGYFDTLRASFEVMQPLMDGIADRMEEAGLGPAEFAFHSRLLWACLRRLDAGMGVAALNPLRGYYNRLNDAYTEDARRSETAIPLDDLIGQFEPDTLVQVEDVLVADVGLVHSGLEMLEVEPFYMNLTHLDDPETMMQRVVYPSDPQRSAEGDGSER